MPFPPSGSTTKYSFAYPLETDVPDVPAFGQLLATGVETTMDSVAKISRQAAGSLMVPGIVRIGDLTTTQHTSPNMTVNVGVGGAWVGGTIAVPAQGNYFYYNPTVDNLSVANNTSGNPRLDAVVLTVKDSDYAGSVDNPGLLQVITGTPAPTPVLPALPANSLLLAKVTVVSGTSAIGTSNIANVAPLAVSLAGVRGNPYARMDLAAPEVGLAGNTYIQLTMSPTDGLAVTMGSSQMTIITPGRYRIHGDLSAIGMVSPGDVALACIAVNGTLVKSERGPADNGNIATPQVSTQVTLATGNTVALVFNQAVVGAFGAEVSTAELSIELVSAF